MNSQISANLSAFFRSRWFWLVLLVVAIRILSVTLAFHNVPPVDMTDGVFTDGGDGMSYFRITNQVLNGDFNYEPHAVGFFIFLAPFILISGATTFAEIANIMAWANGVFLYVLATILVWILAKQILKSNKFANISAFLFLIYPYIFYYLFDLFGTSGELIASFKETRFMQLNFLNVLSDPLSSVLAYASLALLLYVIIKERPMWVYALMGFLLSFFVITRTQNVFAIFFFVPALLVLKRYKGFVYFALAGLPLGILQMLANFIGGGSIFSSPYSVVYGGELNIQLFSFKYPFRVITYPLDHNPFLLVVIIAAAIFLIYGLWRLIRENKRLGWTVASYLLILAAPLFFIESVMRNPRYFLAVIPLVIIIAVYSLRDIYLTYASPRLEQERP